MRIVESLHWLWSLCEAYELTLGQKTTPPKLKKAGWRLLVIDENGYKIVPDWAAIRSAPKKLVFLIGTPAAIRKVAKAPRLYPEDPEEIPGLVFVLRLILGAENEPEAGPDAYTPAWVQVNKKFQRMGWGAAAVEYIRRQIKTNTDKALMPSVSRTEAGERLLRNLTGRLTSSRCYRLLPLAMVESTRAFSL